MDDPDDSPTPRTHKITKRPSLPTVDRSLDKFIEGAKAAPHVHDVSYFDPGTREQAMSKEIDELKSQLAAAEARATKALHEVATSRSEPTRMIEMPTPAKSRWGSLAMAFVIGGACVFGVSALRRPAAPPEMPQAHQSVEPSRLISGQPIQSTTPPPEPPPVPMPKLEPVVEKPVARSPGRVANTTPRPVVTPTTKPAEPKAGSGSSDPGLYNPFGSTP